jgi:hypothetical protein
MVNGKDVLLGIYTLTIAFRLIFVTTESTDNCLSLYRFSTHRAFLSFW